MKLFQIKICLIVCSSFFNAGCVVLHDGAVSDSENQKNGLGNLGPRELERLGGLFRPEGTSKNLSQGTLNESNTPTHIAIEGRGFFQVTRSDGSHAYTRNGQLMITSDGALATEDGLFLSDNIVIPPQTDIEALAIGTDGNVSTMDNGQPQQLGQIRLHQFSNPAALKYCDDNLLIETPASGEVQSGNPGVDGLGRLRQRALEGSNVVLIGETLLLYSGNRVRDIDTCIIQTRSEKVSNLSQALREVK